jgi:hypothetical protein
MRNAPSHEDISREYNGKTYTGYAEIEGTRILSQCINYGDKSKYDSHRYRPDERAYMRSVARIILGELIRESGDLDEK